MGDRADVVICDRVDCGIAVLTLNNPARRNALSLEMRRKLIEYVRSLDADAAVRAIVLTGASGDFCSGGDITGQGQSSLADGRERFRITHELVRLLARGRKPRLAAVEGWAAGAGLSLALLCDTIIASTSAKFSAPFGRLGLVGDLGLLHTLPARIGHGRARQMLLYGEPVSADEALSIGLIDRLAPEGQSLDVAVERARLLSQCAPLPLELTRQYLLRGLDEVLDWEREVQAALMTTDDHREGRTAFLEKRSPQFTGR